MTRLRWLPFGVACGLSAGLFAGIVDAWTTPHAFLARPFLLISVVAWTACAGFAGFAAGLAASVLATPDGSGLRSARGWAAGLPVAALTAVAWFLVVVHVNVAVLESDTSPAALAFDAAATLIAIAGAVLLTRRAAARIETPVRLAPRVVPGLIGGGVALALAFVLWRGGVGEVDAPDAVPPDDAPDVVLLLIDTLRRDHLSGEGYAEFTSPALDEFAARGVRFSDFTSQSCYTKPAVASLLTSRVPSGHRVGHLRTVLAESQLTLAEMFHASGWRTAMFCSNTIVGPEFGFAQGAELFRTLPTALIPKTKLGYALFRFGEAGRDFPPATWLANALSALERRLVETRGAEVLSLPAEEIFADYASWRESIGDEPVFAYLHVMEPHAPYLPPSPERERYEAQGRLFAQHPSTVGLFLPFSRAEPLGEEQTDGLIRAYNAEIAGLDRTLGPFLAELMNGDRPTLVAITSDHGEEFYEHGGWGHGQSLHRELLEVPFVLAGARVPVGRRIQRPAQLIDIAPTLLDLAGVPVPPAFSGRSLRAAWGEVDPADPPPATEILSEIVYGDRYWARALRQGSWKLIVSRLGDGEAVRLYELESDPAEERDLAAEDPERVAGMRSRLEQLVAEAEEGAGDAAFADFDPATRERLEALGYVE